MMSVGHIREYASEALGLGLFMFSAGVFGTLLESPASELHQSISDPFSRRIVMGLAMGLTAIGLIYSPWGRLSGAHNNPAVTITFWSLGKATSSDALFYIIAQFIGGIVGTFAVGVLFHEKFTEPPVTGVATLPGETGEWIAFLSEILISLFMMGMVLTVSSSRWSRWTGVGAGILVTSYIIVEAPLSGMSMNPARTLSSAVVSSNYTSLWIYFTAPILGMLSAALLFRCLTHQRQHCAKYYHCPKVRCIFCGYTPAS
ncbi:MAG TPA: aquaporin [Gemmatales bacterium]|nr:aquaporin [Gemmatales bacterium]